MHQMAFLWHEMHFRLYSVEKHLNNFITIGKNNAIGYPHGSSTLVSYTVQHKQPIGLFSWRSLLHESL
jgi:hypothetical protein